MGLVSPRIPIGTCSVKVAPPLAMSSTLDCHGNIYCTVFRLREVELVTVGLELTYCVYIWQPMVLEKKKMWIQ